MTYYMKSGSRFDVSSKDALDLHEDLPVGTYTVKWDERRGVYYLEGVDSFEIKHKLYGDTRQISARILQSFLERPSQTGVMLSGEKGSGKTLQAKDLSLEAAKLGIPTILINDAHEGEAFNTFMQMIEQPTVIIFDEFEKVYDREEQEKLLTLLDGVYPSKKLFIVTCNDKARVNEQMKNRPGRIYYRLDYEGLEPDFIVEYCEDNLKDTTHIEDIVHVAQIFSQFNFDILKALVEEMNRYGEGPQEAMKFLNAKPEYSSDATFIVALEYMGKEIEGSNLYDQTWRGNPLTGQIRISHSNLKDGVLDDTYTTSKFDATDFVSADGASGRFIFVNSFGTKLSLTRKATETVNYLAKIKSS